MGHSMKVALYGGFGEKGRTCLGIETGGVRLLLDAGVKTSARGRADYYPAIPAEHLRDAAAIVVTHAHEDHAAAIGRFIAQGFRGRIFMTAETEADCAALLDAYADGGDAVLLRDARIERLRVGADALSLAGLTVHTGRSGHIAGGVWCVLDDGAARFGYCGDVACESPVFAMDPLPAVDAIAVDASYGDDDTRFAQRAASIASWVDAHPRGSVLPTPQYGRSLELFAVLRGGVVLAPGMRESLTMQLRAASWLQPGTQALQHDVDAARDWRPGDPLPAAAVLCHDGMGMHGPSRELLALAERDGRGVLLTGHVPDGSPGDRLRKLGLADWLRLPTHPTLHENQAIVRDTAARLVLGHSCEPDVLDALAGHMPQLRRVATGDVVEIG
jgi:Cft2 family RNA processing exonuclease